MPDVKPRGRLDAPIVFVGDVPTPEDFQYGKAWSGTVHENMNEFLRMVDIDPNDVLFLPCVSYAKPSFTYKMTADDIIPDADHYLIPTIAMHPRKLVMAFGNNALCAVGIAPKPEKVMSLRRRPLESLALEDAGVKCAVACSTAPYGILKEPEAQDDFIGDLEFAKRLMSGDLNFQLQYPMHIVDLEHPDDIEKVVKAAKASGVLAYDYETTGLNPLTDYPVTLSLCAGEKTADGATIVYWWAGYDRLVPRFDADTLNTFKERFLALFRLAGTEFDLVSFNGNFDDWMGQTWLDDPDLPGSQFDVMLMKWQINNKRPHGLKEATSRYCGVANYDGDVDFAVKEIAARRGRILKHEDDFNVIKLFGLTPVKTKTGFKWPEGVDKKLAAYAMLDYETLRRYGCYDSLYTLELFFKFGKVIEADNLVHACDLRHRIRVELLKAQQRGMLVDVERAKQFSAELLEIENICDKKIMRALEDMGYDLPSFNPNSGQQLSQVLFGKPVFIPTFMPGTIVNSNMDYSVAVDRCEVVEEAVYGENYRLVEHLVATEGDVDYSMLERKLRDEFRRRFNTTVVPKLTKMPLYLRGLTRPESFTKTGLPATGSAILKALNENNPSDFLSLVLMLRRASKLRGTFVDGVLKRMDSKNIVRAFFNTIGTETGRISSSNPNAQNFVKSLRGILIPRPGYRFIEWDLSQAEIRAVAAYSGDAKLIAALNSSDIHSTIASMIFNLPLDQVGKDSAERRYAKTIVFGIIYGMSAWRLHMALSSKDHQVSLNEAQDFIDKFFAAFPDLKKWLDSQVALGRRPPYYVYTPWGTRRSTLNMLSEDPKVISHTERIAMNMPIQGAAGELTLFYICEIMDRVRARGYDVHMVNTTHDSCTLEVPEALVLGAPLRTPQVCSCQKGKLKEDQATCPEGTMECPNCRHVFEPAGPIIDIINEVINNTEVLPYPLNTVNFVADMEVNDAWAGMPDLKKALDPRKDTFMWELLKAEEVMERDELEEFLEVEACALAQV